MSPNLQFSLLSFLPCGHKEYGDAPRNAVLAFFAIHGFATLPPRFAPSGNNNNVARSTARGRQGISSRYMDCAVRVPRARQIETHAFPGGSLQFAARIPCAQRVRDRWAPTVLRFPVSLLRSGSPCFKR